MPTDLLSDVPLMDLHRAAGETAGLACLEKAERGGFDGAAAAEYIVALLRADGPTAGEVLTDRAIAAGFRPHDSRAFGPVYAALARRKAIRCVGYCERTKGNGTAGGRIWSLA